VDQPPFDVVIVGAGFAGLMVGRELRRTGRRVAVLEARDRVGGRALTRPLADGTRGDLGAGWIGEGHVRLSEPVEELGLQRVRQQHDGRSLMAVDGHV
jgi:monoamine oxidase